MIFNNHLLCHPCQSDRRVRPVYPSKTAYFLALLLTPAVFTVTSQAKNVLCEKERNSIERRGISQWDFDIYFIFFYVTPKINAFTAFEANFRLLFTLL